MDEGLVGFLVFIGIVLISSAISHWLIHRHILASFCAMFFGNLFFQVAAYWHIGYLDKFFIISILVGGIIAFAIAEVVGLFFPHNYIKENHPD